MLQLPVSGATQWQAVGVNPSGSVSVSSTLREADVYCVREDSSTRSIKTCFLVDADGRFDTFVPAGRVKLLPGRPR